MVDQKMKKGSDCLKIGKAWMVQLWPVWFIEILGRKYMQMVQYWKIVDTKIFSGFYG